MEKIQWDQVVDGDTLDKIISILKQKKDQVEDADTLDRIISIMEKNPIRSGCGRRYTRQDN